MYYGVELSEAKNVWLKKEPKELKNHDWFPSMDRNGYSTTTSRLWKGYVVNFHLLTENRFLHLNQWTVSFSFFGSYPFFELLESLPPNDHYLIRWQTLCHWLNARPPSIRHYRLTEGHFHPSKGVVALTCLNSFCFFAPKGFPLQNVGRLNDCRLPAKCLNVVIFPQIHHQ